MNTQYQQVIFDLELAKRIASGKEKGRFGITHKEDDGIRIVCWDMHTDLYDEDEKEELHIVALVQDDDPNGEDAYFFNSETGKGVRDNVNFDLYIEIPVVSDKEKLEELLNSNRGCESITFGRVMPFGKYKGENIYTLVVKHPNYIKWVIEDTTFKLTDTEIWWREIIEEKRNEVRSERRLNNLLVGLSRLMGSGICGDLDEYENNPHAIVE